MKNYIFLLIVLFGTTLSFAQKNETKVNDVKELAHYLNKTGDSLRLESDFPINTVEFQQESFSEKHEVNKNNVSLPINKLPYGKVLVLVGVNYKSITFDLYRKLNASDKSPIKRHKRGDTLAIKTNGDVNKLMEVGINSLSEIKEKTTFSFEDEDKPKVVEPIDPDKPKFYWAVVSINQNFGSTKTSMIVNEKDKINLINKNKYDLESKNGGRNGLIIWEVYNVSSFTKARSYNSNPSQISPKFVNPVPIYDSSLN